MELAEEGRRDPLPAALLGWAGVVPDEAGDGDLGTRWYEEGCWNQFVPADPTGYVAS